MFSFVNDVHRSNAAKQAAAIKSKGPKKAKVVQSAPVQKPLQGRLYSPCRYLFNREVEEVFLGQNPEFVEESLGRMMRITDHIMSTNSDALFLCGPMANNKQCHLYALMTAQTVEQRKIGPVLAEALNFMPADIHGLIQDYADTVERRFVYLSVFLSNPFMNDLKLLVDVALKALRDMKEAVPSGAFFTFLKDPSGARTHAARIALNQLFEAHMKRILSTTQGPLYPELSALAGEDLRLAPTVGAGTLYTYPHLPGICHMLDAALRGNIALMLKVKVMTTEGNGFLSHCNQNLQAVSPKAPVIVFELLATDTDLAAVITKEYLKRCPSYSQRNPSKENRHKEDAPCLFCRPQRVQDMTQYAQQILPLLERQQSTLLAFAADCTREHERPFSHFFADGGKYPRLKALFESCCPPPEDGGLVAQFERLSIRGPLRLSVLHVRPDSARQARQDTLLIDAPFEAHLRQRGLT